MAARAASEASSSWRSSSPAAAYRSASSAPGRRRVRALDGGDGGGMGLGVDGVATARRELADLLARDHGRQRAAQALGHDDDDRPDLRGVDEVLVRDEVAEVLRVADVDAPLDQPQGQRRLGRLERAAADRQDHDRAVVVGGPGGEGHVGQLVHDGAGVDGAGRPQVVVVALDRRRGGDRRDLSTSAVAVRATAAVRRAGTRRGAGPDRRHGAAGQVEGQQGEGGAGEQGDRPDPVVEGEARELSIESGTFEPLTTPATASAPTMTTRRARSGSDGHHRRAATASATTTSPADTQVTASSGAWMSMPSRSGRPRIGGHPRAWTTWRPAWAGPTLVRPSSEANSTIAETFPGSPWNSW